MDASLANLLRRRLNEVRAAGDPHDTDQPVRLLPDLSSDDLPPEFEDVLQVQVLGYREQIVVANGRRVHVAEPVWTLVPKDR